MFQGLRDELRLHGGTYFLLVVLFVGFGLTPLPYVRSAPGATYDALGKIDGTPLVEIAKSSEYPTYKTTGEIRILTVSQWGGPYGTLSWFDAVRSLWDHSIFIIPTRFLFAENTDPNAVQDESQIQFASAQSSAIGAAFHYLKLPVREFTSIVFVDRESPNKKLLKVGDQLISADGKPIASSADFGKVMATKSVGDSFEVTIKRGDQTKQLNLKTYARDGETKVRIGVVLLADFEPPVKVKFGLEEVGGPSAGLAFALTLVDKLDGRDVAAGRTIAVTGEIDGDGNVGAIGGIPQKMAAATRAGAKIMLFPRDNCPIKTENVPSELTMVPVSTLAEAVDVLTQRNPARYPTC